MTTIQIGSIEPLVSMRGAEIAGSNSLGRTHTRSRSRRHGSPDTWSTPEASAAECDTDPEAARRTRSARWRIRPFGPGRRQSTARAFPRDARPSAASGRIRGGRPSRFQRRVRRAAGQAAMPENRPPPPSRRIPAFGCRSLGRGARRAILRLTPWLLHLRASRYGGQAGPLITRASASPSASTHCGESLAARAIAHSCLTAPRRNRSTTPAVRQ
jgi:hypothetical protein